MTPRRATRSAAGVALACMLCFGAPTAVAQQPAGNDSIGNDGAARLSAGIDAFVGGDYATAGDLLRPLAERWPREPDPTAAFFMASMYDGGLGVAQDPIRACALYALSGAAMNGPTALTTLAGSLFRESHSSMPPEQRGQCQMLWNLGFYHQFQPEAFQLGPDHQVTLNLDTNGVAATVSYRGRETRTTTVFSPRSGARFLPLRLTELDAQGRSPGRRHLVEIAAWAPEGLSWKLTWTLLEVSGETLAGIAAEVVVATSEEVPEPDEAMRDIRRWVSLDLNERGEAQWAMREGTNLRAEVIPSPAERQEQATADQARRAVEKRVNWDKTADPERPPSFRYAASDGCANLQVFGWSADRTELVSVRLDRERLPATTEPVLVDLSAAGPDADVAIDVFDRAQRQWPHCQEDVLDQAERRQETWRAVSGVASVTLSEPGIRAAHPQQYQATVQIQDAEFIGPSGARVRATRAITLTAVVGPP